MKRMADENADREWTAEETAEWEAALAKGDDQEWTEEETKAWEAHLGAETSESDAPKAESTEDVSASVPASTEGAPEESTATSESVEEPTATSESAELVPDVSGATATSPEASAPSGTLVDEDEGPIEPLTIEELVEQNPHCRQMQAAHAQPYLADCLTSRKVDRFIHRDSPGMEYVKRKDADRTCLHWGQLKLFESELYCLSNYTNAARGEPWTIIYAGAAPGMHFDALVSRFPGCHFELYDPADFLPSVFELAEKSGGRVKVFNKFFDEDVVDEIISRKLENTCFICDIRTADPQQQHGQEIEDLIEKDMTRQLNWTRQLKATISLLKFRLPWAAGFTRYAKGEIMLQCFPPLTSTETRLVVKGEDATTWQFYDNKVYEKQCMFHNTVTRSAYHHHNVKVEGLDRCYDCAALVDSVRTFLRSKDGVGKDVKISDERVGFEIESIIADINDNGRSLASAYHVSSIRHGGRQFQQRKYHDEEGKDKFQRGKQNKRHKNWKKRGSQSASNGGGEPEAKKAKVD